MQAPGAKAPGDVNSSQQQQPRHFGLLGLQPPARCTIETETAAGARPDRSVRFDLRWRVIRTREGASRRDPTPGGAWNLASTRTTSDLPLRKPARTPGARWNIN